MRKIKIIGIFVIFVLSVISHFIYEWVPNKFFSLFFPVNESIWEHMKLIITPVLFYSLVEYIMYKRKNIYFNNFIFSYAIAILLTIIIYLIIYIPIDYIFGHSAVVAISLLFITFIIVEYISYRIMNYTKIKYSNISGSVIVILLYIIFGYLTYNPIKTGLFFDTQEKNYGIPREQKTN